MTTVRHKTTTIRLKTTLQIQNVAHWPQKDVKLPQREAKSPQRETCESVLLLSRGVGVGGLYPEAHCPIVYPCTLKLHFFITKCSHILCNLKGSPGNDWHFFQNTILPVGQKGWPIWAQIWIISYDQDREQICSDILGREVLHMYFHNSFVMKRSQSHL